MSHSRFLAVLLMVALAIAAHRYFAAIERAQDIEVYRDIGVAFSAPAEPAPQDGRYPPLASALFVLLQRNPLRLEFAEAWTWFVLLSVAAAALYQAWRLDEGPVPVPAAIFASLFVLHPEPILSRYDVLVGIVLLLSWRAHVGGRYGDSGVFAVFAASLKIVPALVLPLLFFATPRSGRRTFLAGAGIGIVSSIVIPCSILGPARSVQNLVSLACYQTARGVQVETLWSGLDLLRHLAAGTKASFDVAAMSWDNEDLGIGIARGASVLVLLGVGLVTWLSVRWRHQGADVGIGIVTTLLWTLGVTPVFQPQYLVWLMPMLLVLCTRLLHDRLHRGDRCAKVVVWLTIVVGAGTQWIYPYRYEAFLEQSSWIDPLVLNLRNLALLALVGALLVTMKNDRPRSASA